MIFYDTKGKPLKFDHFSIVKAIGKGGFGTLYLIEEKQAHTFFALKHLHGSYHVKRIQAYLDIIQELNSFD